jgi:hypothetical protein
MVEIKEKRYKSKDTDKQESQICHPRRREEKPYCVSRIN